MRNGFKFIVFDIIYITVFIPFLILATNDPIKVWIGAAEQTVVTSVPLTAWDYGSKLIKYSTPGVIIIGLYLAFFMIIFSFILSNRTGYCALSSDRRIRGLALGERRRIADEIGWVAYPFYAGDAIC